MSRELQNVPSVYTHLIGQSRGNGDVGVHAIHQQTIGGRVSGYPTCAISSVFQIFGNSWVCHRAPATLTELSVNDILRTNRCRGRDKEHLTGVKLNRHFYSPHSFGCHISRYVSSWIS